MKADVPDAIRKRLIVSGNVQEAGYRMLVKSVARKMGVVGFVRNLLDETVEIVCEGNPKTLEKFMKAIDRKGDPGSPTDLDVKAIQETPAPIEGEFKTFKVEYNGMLTPEERERARDARDERMVLGASELKDEIKMVGKTVEGVGQKVDGVGKAVEGVGQKVDSMHTDMNTRFDHMAKHYDMIAISLKEAIVHMDRNAEKTDKAIEKSRKETIIAVRKSEERTAKMLRESRKDVAASNRELAKAVNFMIRKLSDRPVRKRPAEKRKR